MKQIVLSMAALLCACGASTTTPMETPVHLGTRGPEITPAALPMADAAGNRMEQLTQGGDGASCTDDRAWCVQLAGAPHVNRNGASISFTPPPFDDEQEVWHQIIRVGREDTVALIGVETRTHQMYSGGDAGATQVTLYEVANGAAREVMTFPVSGAADIRACFSEEDQARRADACSDLYGFVSRVTLDESVTDGAPRIVLETVAGTYPGHRSRNEDSSDAPPLQPSDLVWAADSNCSYRRVASRIGDAYVWDAPLPACTDYLEP